MRDLLRDRLESLLVNMNRQTKAEHWIETPRGRIFGQSWLPRDCESSAPIVLFHDSLGCIQLWRDFPSLLAEATKRKVIAYDRLGFGKSDRRNEKSPLDFVTEEAELLFPLLRDRLGFEKFVAFGHSVGGAMAVLCAGRFPKECVAVITESAQTFVEDRTLEGISAAKKNFENPEQFTKIEKYHGDKALWVLRAWTDVWLSAEFASWSLKDELPKVKCPLLAIHGEKDEYGSQKFPEMLAGTTGGPAEKLILSGCGHIPHKEKQEVVLKAVARFLKNQSRD